MYVVDVYLLTYTTYTRACPRRCGRLINIAVSFAASNDKLEKVRATHFPVVVTLAGKTLHRDKSRSAGLERNTKKSLTLRAPNLSLLPLMLLLLLFCIIFYPPATTRKKYLKNFMQFVSELIGSRITRDNYLLDFITIFRFSSRNISFFLLVLEKSIEFLLVWCVALWSRKINKFKFFCISFDRKCVKCLPALRDRGR